MNPLARLLAVGVPGFFIALLLGAQAGQGNVVLCVLVILGVLVFAASSVLARSGRLEVAIVAFLIFGYIVGSRGFAELAPVRPFFVGEIGLMLVTVMLIARSVLARDAAIFRTALAKLVALYFVVAAVRCSFTISQYGLTAIRDLAAVYYCIFFFVALQLGSRPKARQFFARCLQVTFFCQAIVAVASMVTPDLLGHVVVAGIPVLAQKGDLTAAFSVVGIFFLSMQRELFGLRWLRTAVVLVLTATVFASSARAALVAFATGAVFIFLAGARRFFIYPLVVILGGLFLLFSADVLMERSHRSETMNRFHDKIYSIVDFSSEATYRTELGETKAANNAFRSTFWKVMVNETTKDNPFFGKGFGYDFLPNFERYYARGGWHGLRSPHNYYVTVYGRMGLVGFAIFAAITLLIFRGAWHASRNVRLGRVEGSDFSYWCCTIALLVAGTFGVVLEGPMGAIPFWTFLGFAVSSVAARQQQRDILPQLPHRTRQPQLADAMT
jgi:O-antigen ligase